MAIKRKQEKTYKSLDEEIWSFIKGCKISWKGLLSERLGRHYLRQQGYKISTCHCERLLHDREGWRYVHKKLDPDDSEIGYWEKGGHRRARARLDASIDRIEHLLMENNLVKVKEYNGKIVIIISRLKKLEKQIVTIRKTLKLNTEGA